MDVASGSIFCQIFLALGRLLALSWEECGLNRFLRFLARAGRQSLTGRVCRAVSDRWKAWWHGSVLVRFFFEKEGLLPRSWPGSGVYRFLSLLVNLPAAVLHWVYVKLRPCFDSSFFASLAFGLGEQVPIAAGWLMLAVMNIDYSMWSNGYSLVGFAAILLLFVAGGMRRRSLRLDLAGVGLYPMLFFLAVCLSWPLSCYPELSGRYLPYHITCALCVVLTVSAVERADQLERLAVFGCLGMAGAAAYGVYQRFLGIIAVDIAYVDLTVNPDMPGRIFSYYQNSNAFSEMLVCLIPVAVGLVIGAKKPVNRFLGFVCAVLGGTALVMTYGRASWIGLAIAALIFLFFWKRSWIPVCLAAAVILLPFLPAGVLQRIASIFNPHDSSTTSRIPLMQAGLRMIKASPIRGAGLGADAVRKLAVDINAMAANGQFTHSHNLYLQLWLEHGLLGLATFLAGGWHMLKQGARAFQSSHAPRLPRFIALGAASALAGSLVSGFADYLFTYPRVMLIFWFSASLLLAGAKLTRRSQRAGFYGSPQKYRQASQL